MGWPLGGLRYLVLHDLVRRVLVLRGSGSLIGTLVGAESYGICVLVKGIRASINHTAACMEVGAGSVALASPGSSTLISASLQDISFSTSRLL